MMDNDAYCALLTEKFKEINAIASEAKAKGYDPETFVEIKAAPDLASRVEGIIGMEGLAKLVRERSTPGKSRQMLAFEMVKEICENKKFSMDLERRLTLALRVGLSVLTEGILVAPTEGLQGVELHKNQDGTDYIAVLYAGPIRGAGGTSAALSVALADYGRRILGIGNYKATDTEAERWLEEILTYHSRKARLQYLPSEEDIKYIIGNCPVCVDGVPTENIEVGTHRNLKRLDKDGNEQQITNKVRGGIGLVVCEGIAQKAKSVLKYTKNAGLDWSWLSNVIKVDKGAQTQQALAKEDRGSATFLQELVAGRPVFAYPDYPGSFRLRYGRSRLTGIAAKGFSPATMHILGGFIATGTQLKMDKAGKGCVATPVDSIEGPFVKLDNGEALRINSAEQARAVAGRVSKILSVGDILITYGDFKKSSSPLLPTSYVEEYWAAQLRAQGFRGELSAAPTFREAFALSKEYGVPMHPLYIYDYAEVESREIAGLAAAALRTGIDRVGDGLFGVHAVEFDASVPGIRDTIERICIPHFDDGKTIVVKDDAAQSLLAALGLYDKDGLRVAGNVLERYDTTKRPLDMLNAVSPFKIIKRATRIGGRMGRPEKARERLMEPPPNVLFPIGEYGGKERNLYKFYMEERKKFGKRTASIEIAAYRCPVGRELVPSPYCRTHTARAFLERVCKSCGRVGIDETCGNCGGRMDGFRNTDFTLADYISSAMERIGMQVPPKSIKGVKGLVSSDKIAEPLEKGLLRGAYGVSIFKDGTARFDATDVPVTHFYPSEVGVSVERLKELGYTHDYLGKELIQESQLLELRHQDVILNTRCADYLLRVARFIDELLVKFYGMKPFYNIDSKEGLLGHCVITLSPHTSCGVLGRIVGFTNASVGLAHPYTISARRRNCDGDEDTTMLALDALVNFSKRYLPTTIGGTMDAPLIMTLHVVPEEVDDEVHAMEIVDGYSLAFYERTLNPALPDAEVENVGSRMQKPTIYAGLGFTHGTGPTALADSPTRSMYTQLKSMQEKIDTQFKLMDMLYTVDRQDVARKLILSHFIPDLMGNLHSFSKQSFRCVKCNAKYRRVPLSGACKRQGCGGRLVLTIAKGGIEKYLNTAIALADRYNLEQYIKQRIMLIKDEIETVFGNIGGGTVATGQFDLSNYM